MLSRFTGFFNRMRTMLKHIAMNCSAPIRPWWKTKKASQTPSSLAYQRRAQRDFIQFEMPLTSTVLRSQKVIFNRMTFLKSQRCRCCCLCCCRRCTWYFKWAGYMSNVDVDVDRYIEIVFFALYLCALASEFNALHSSCNGFLCSSVYSLHRSAQFESQIRINK